MDKPNEEQIVDDLQQLTESIEKLTKIVERVEDKKYLKMITNPRKFILYSFLHGIFIALGSSIGVVIVLGIIAYILKTLQFIPVIGDFTSQVLPFLGK